MIPKVIHYCWFGKGPLPQMAIDCINSWKKHMPDWEVKEWNESNFDINISQYTREAYDSKKYAFVADYARFYVLNNYGGIYMDVDVELLRPLDRLVSNLTVVGMECPGRVNPGLICISKKDTIFLKEMLNCYDKLRFINDDGTLNLTTIVDYTSSYLEEIGMMNINEIQHINEIVIYPIEYFCPIDMKTNQLIITENTYSIHHFAASWLSPWSLFKKRMRKTLGYRFYNILHKIKGYFKGGRTHA